MLTLGVIHYLRYRSKQMTLLRKIREGKNQRGEVVAVRTNNGATSRLGEQLTRLLRVLGERLKTDKSVDYSKMRLDFLKAGFRRHDAPHVFMGAKLVVGLALPLSFFAFRLKVVGATSSLTTIGLVVFFALLGLQLPNLWLRVRIAKRKEDLKDGFANVLDLLVVCVEAGMGLDAAITRVGIEIAVSNRAWSEELKLFNLELRAGKSRREALKNLAMRTDIEDVNSLATALIQTDRFGTSLAKALRVYSDSFRTKRYQKAEEIAAKLPVKLVLPAVLLIFPSLFVAIAGPAAMQVYHILLQR
jgi:tight adherence protein C